MSPAGHAPVPTLDSGRRYAAALPATVHVAGGALVVIAPGRRVDDLEHRVVERAVREEQRIDEEGIGGVDPTHVYVQLAVGVPAGSEQVRRYRRESNRAAVAGDPRLLYPLLSSPSPARAVVGAIHELGRAVSPDRGPTFGVAS